MRAFDKLGFESYIIFVPSSGVDNGSIIFMVIVQNKFILVPNILAYNNELPFFPSKLFYEALLLY